jgi:hypothetical protein
VDTATLVTRDIQDGQRFLDQLVGEGIPIRAACLVKLQNRYKSSLYIATPLVDQKGATQAYREVLDALRPLDGVWRDPTDTSLVSENHPLVRDVQELRRRHLEGFLPSDISAFGGMAVDGVYIYPPSEAFPGFNQLKQRFPSAEVFPLYLPSDRFNPGGMTRDSIFSLRGKVNAAEFEGKPPETLLFFGGSPNSVPVEDYRLVFVYRPEGWNTQYDDNAKQWRRVVFAGTNRPLYEPVDFTPLAELKAPPAAASA